MMEKLCWMNKTGQEREEAHNWCVGERARVRVLERERYQIFMLQYVLTGSSSSFFAQEDILNNRNKWSSCPGKCTAVCLRGKKMSRNNLAGIFQKYSKLTRKRSL